MESLMASDNIAIAVLAVVLGWFMFRLEKTMTKINTTIEANTAQLARAEKALGNASPRTTGEHEALSTSGATRAITEH